MNKNDFKQRILWNHSYLLGPMCVDCQILLVCEDKISWVTGLLHYNERQFISSLNHHRDVNLWVRLTHEIHEHGSPMNNDVSTVLMKCTLYFT